MLESLGCDRGQLRPFDRLKRRSFFTLLGGAAAAWPLAARAQQGEVRRVGALISATENDPEVGRLIAAFKQGLLELG